MNTYLRIISYVRPYWKHLVLTFIFTIFYALLNGASVYLTIPLLDTLFQESATKKVQQQTQIEQAKSFLPDWIQNIQHSVTESFNQYILSGDKADILIKICFVILIAFLFKNIFAYLQGYFMSYVEYGAMKDLRDEAYQHLHKLPISYFKRERVGNLISRFTNDVNIVQASISATFSNLIKEPLTIIVFLGIALSISWQLTLFAFVILPFSMAIIAWIGFKLRKQTTRLQEKLADITSVLQETISGVKIVKAFGMEEFENKRFMKETKEFFRLVLKIVRVRNASSPLTEFLSVIVGAFIIYYGGLLVLEKNTITASQFLGFLFAIFQMMPPIKELSSVNNRIQEASAAGDRIFEILDTEPDIKDVPDAIELKEFKDSIHFRNVSFKYEDSEEWVLSDINFSVNKGEIIALVGPSGGGKSTLVDLIPRFYDPTDGQIILDGTDIRKYSLKSLRSKMGIVTQETFLFNTTIRENIAYGLSDCPMEKIIEAAKTANAHNFIMEMPQQYETIIGERGVKLSGGQRQRLTIARALLKNPEIMIFDEATSALDNESEILVQEAIERLMENRTTFVIAHRLSTIRNATKIIVIDRGKIIQHGTHDELIADEKGLYKKLYEMQFRDNGV
ncbi:MULTISPECIES: ABC transporter ATP-binding protein [Ignavibacterium]|jgi:subfamily B ATP-binding cassette protein MsbA|uniref:ABC transporter ATP-binding protein n=1 Tax=Ignavibacterium TaxID=795750 RepID=UPI0025BD6308|nr:MULTISPECIES: ABC transporter ATP-binding protein [Ignavibacterium]MBI5661849.1 ABC transporter ATP-binding protein [Ignavibacterium album]